MPRSDSDSYDDRRSHRRSRSRRRSPVYEEEEIIRARKGPKGSTKEVIRRRSDSTSSTSTEEIQRDFPPRGHDRNRDRRRQSSKSRTKKSRRHDSPDNYSSYDDRSRRRRHDRRRSYSSSSYDSSPPPKKRERRKSHVEEALGALGLGGVAAALSGRSKSHDRGTRDRGRSPRKDRRQRYSSSSDSSSGRSRSRRDRRKKDHRSSRDKKNPHQTQQKIIQAAKAAAIAGGTEAWRVRKEPGGWSGPKGRRILTAAVGAAGVDGLIDKDPNKDSTLHTIEAVLGGLAGNHLINGSRSADTSRVRTGGDGVSGGEAAAGGFTVGAMADMAAKAYQSHRNSRQQNQATAGRGRRDYSSSSDDSRDRVGYGPRRSKSVSDYMRQGAAKLGFGGNSDPRAITDRDYANRDMDGHQSAPSDTDRLGPRGPPEGPPGPMHGDVPPGSMHGDARFLPHSRDAGEPPPQTRSMNGTVGPPLRRPSHPEDFMSSSDSESDSAEEEKERKKLGRKQLITAGLASVATIHAAHNVYQSYQTARVRRKEVAEGEMSKKEARRKKTKSNWQNAAAIGIAALGVKGAYSEWKEVKEQHEEMRKAEMDRVIRHERKTWEHEHESELQNSANQSQYSLQSGSGQQHGVTSWPSSDYPHGQREPGYDAQHHPEQNYTTDHAHTYYDQDGPHYADGNPYSMSGGISDPPEHPQEPPHTKT